MTHLSVKALRHYHDQGLLAPADIDRQSGYRLYADRSAVPTGRASGSSAFAQSRLECRSVTISVVIDAPDLATRNEIIVDHLNHMERQLEQTQLSVAALRAILEPALAPIADRIPASSRRPCVVAIAASVQLETHRHVDGRSLPNYMLGWHRRAYVLDDLAEAPISTEWLFTDEVGDCIVHVCLPPRSNQRARAYPGAPRGGVLRSPSITVCTTPPTKTKALLNGPVAGRAIGVEGPIREHYLVTMDDTADAAAMRTEICWPIFRTMIVNKETLNAPSICRNRWPKLPQREARLRHRRPRCHTDTRRRDHRRRRHVSGHRGDSRMELARKHGLKANVYAQRDATV